MKGFFRTSVCWLPILLMLMGAACQSPQTSVWSQQETTKENSARSAMPASTRSADAEPTSPTTTERTEATLASTETNLALISASSSDDTQAVQRLLAQGADVHARDDTGGTTPLIAAAYGNHVEVARILIGAGANVNVKDETQQSAYLISTSEVGDDPRLLELTLANGADVSSLDSYNGTGLIRASERGYDQIVQELLETDIDVNHVNNLGWTALLEAIILGDCGPAHAEVVRLLVEAGADANLADSNGVTPLQHAQQQGCTEIAKILEDAAQFDPDQVLGRVSSTRYENSSRA